ncbi:TonB-dependent receptor domain-containing protein [Salegentibacter chungangensis]|uniref:TonB-dependent receptor domain-containing protein n=1 Tax=Salegentibacter chungangensis TaxID=1335724 RepID=A0ABW3NSG8_9FLAO
MKFFLKANFFIFFLLFSVNSFTQNFEGIVLNEKDSKPVTFALIRVFEKGISTETNAEGRFELKIEEFPVELEVSASGYKVRKVRFASGEGPVKIYLQKIMESLSEVVVRSAVIPNDLQKTPAAVGVISARDMERSDAANLVQVFNNVSGVYVNQGALNTNKINIRGIGARSQYSTNRIQAYFDGIPLTTAEGELTLDDIDRESLERIEVIKGPTSSIYGAGLGGSINLYSAEPQNEGIRAGVSSDFGSFGMRKQTAKASFSNKKASFFANYSNLTTDGYRENSDYERKSFLMNGRLKISEKNQLSFLVNFTRLKAYIPSSLNQSDFLNDPEAAAQNWADARGYESYDRGMLGVSNQYHFSDKFSNISSVFMSFRDAYEPRPFNILEEERTSAGARTKFNLKTNFIQLPSELSFGAEAYREWYETGTFENLYEEPGNAGSVQGEPLSKNEQDREYANFFVQFNLEFSRKWNLEAGFNINTTAYSLTDLYDQDETDQSGDYRFKTIFSPRLATTYELSPGKNIYASVSHGFSTPTVAETLTPEGLINTSLQPEAGVNYEIGFKGNWLENRLYTEFALYSIQIENLLVAQRVGEDQYVGVNAGQTDHNGVEFLLNYNFELSESISLQPYLNTSLNFFEFDEFVNEGVDNSGNELPGVPKSVLNLGLDVESDFGLSFHSSFRNVSEIPLNDSNSVYSEGYSLVNIKAVYEIALIDDLKLKINAGINNLFDEHYAASVLTNAVGFGGAEPRYYYPGNPRNYFAGLSLDYLF